MDLSNHIRKTLFSHILECLNTFEGRVKEVDLATNGEIFILYKSEQIQMAEHFPRRGELQPASGVLYPTTKIHKLK